MAKAPEVIGFTIEDDTGVVLGIEHISADKPLSKVLEQERFMEEELQVFVYASSNENEPPHGIINVNGINQPFFRDAITPMRRKYVEVLARMKETKYSQPSQDMTNPERSNTVIPRTMNVYPFEVRHDPNPLGRAWLNQIMREAA